MERREILERAMEAVSGKRAQDHGDLENSFFMIAKLWSAYWGETFKPKDVACMMALLKIARTFTDHDELDSYVDACGYMACAGELDENLMTIPQDEVYADKNNYVETTIDKRSLM